MLTQFRIMAGSYEHNLLCLLVVLGETPVFQPVFHFQAHSLSIKCIDLAKRYLVTGSNDEHIRIYDLQKRKELGTLLLHQGTVTTLRFSRETDAATASKALDSTATPTATARDSSGRWLLSGSEDGKIIIWRTKDWEPFATLKGHTEKVADLDIHPSGRVAISVLKDQTVRLWNLMTAKKAAVLKIKGRDHRGEAGEFVRWVNGGSHFIVGLLNMVLVYHTATAKCVRKFRFKSTLMHMEPVQFDDCEWFVTAHANGRLDFFKTVDLLADEAPKDLAEEVIEPNFSLVGHTNRIKDFVFYKDSNATKDVPYIVSVGSEGKIVVWDLVKRDQVAVYDTGERLNCVTICSEDVERMDTVKRAREEIADVSGSEYETDGEEIKKIMGKKKKKGKKPRKVTVTLE